MPKWVQEAFSEYEKRLPKEWKPKLVEFAVAKRGKNHSVDQLKDNEAEQIVSAIPPGAHVVALDVLGKQPNTIALSKTMDRWQLLGQTVCIVIGGPDGLSQRCLDRAHEKLSLSNLTLPHPLVRIVLIEQLYRGWSILQNHPYHK